MKAAAMASLIFIMIIHIISSFQLNVCFFILVLNDFLSSSIWKFKLRFMCFFIRGRKLLIILQNSY